MMKETIKNSKRKYSRWIQVDGQIDERIECGSLSLYLKHDMFNRGGSVAQLVS